MSDDLFQKAIRSQLFKNYTIDHDPNCMIRGITIQSVDEYSGSITMFVWMNLYGNDISGPVVLHELYTVVLPILKCEDGHRYVILIKSPCVAAVGYVMECPRYPLKLDGINISGTVVHDHGEFYTSAGIINELVRLRSFQIDVTHDEIRGLFNRKYGDNGTICVVNFEDVLDIVQIDIKAMYLYQCAINTKY